MLALFLFVIERRSPGKINLLLNILGKRPDGFHELETVLHPIGLWDQLTFERRDPGIELICDHPGLPAGPGNLAHRAAAHFLERARIQEGVEIQLKKQIPLAAGLAGGSSNAAQTLLGLNELFEHPLSQETLSELAARLGSDVPFFLQEQPALALGRGEKIRPLPWFAALKDYFALLIHPGFGISTAWAYEKLADDPEALHGTPGRAERLAAALQQGILDESEFYNALEKPVLKKYPILAMYQEFLKHEGAPVVMMSGSGSTTFALVSSANQAGDLTEKFRSRFGDTAWVRTVPLQT